MRIALYISFFIALLGASCSPHGYGGAHRAKGHKVKKNAHVAKHAQKEIGHIQKSNLKHTENQTHKKQHVLDEGNQNQHHETPSKGRSSSPNDGSFNFY